MIKNPNHILLAYTKTTLILSISLLTACTDLSNKSNILKSNINPIAESSWKIGGKIHFEKVSGADYIGLNEINALTKDALKSVLHITKESCGNNAKILLKRQNDYIQIDHYTEKSRPDVGEEMHATLLYTSPRGFCDSETFKQVCPVLFKNCKYPVAIENVVKKYQSIIKPDWRFKIEEIKVYENEKNILFSAILSFESHKNIHLGGKHISAGLHLTLVQCFDPTIFNKQTIYQCLEILNQLLKGKLIDISNKNGVADLEFGISGQPWRIRAGKRMELQTK